MALEYYGGSGYANAPAYGKYRVKFGDSGEKTFHSLYSAIAFYEKLECEKSLWDENIVPELLEAHSLTERP